MGTEQILGALLIFGLRICDVSIGTLRTLYMVRGDRVRAIPLALVESGIWIIAISRVMAQVSNPLNMAAYAGGYAMGTLLGMTIEKWIASGWIVARIVSGEGATALAAAIRAAGFGVTVTTGEGREGDHRLMFVVTHRRRGQELLDLVKRIDPQAFLTVDPVHQAIGGFMPHHARAMTVRK